MMLGNRSGFAAHKPDKVVVEADLEMVVVAATDVVLLGLVGADESKTHFLG